MADEQLRNILSNGSFEEGEVLPTGWQWAVVSGRPAWAFDYEVKWGSGRSIKILQDVGKVHGEFRQSVKCEGGKRYRLRARIRLAVEGTGEQSGANLTAKSMAGGRQIHELYYRPFLAGQEDWALWSADYVTAKEADTLVVGFDMRNSSGVAWFDAVEVFEAEAPLCESVSPAEGRASISTAGRTALTACILYLDERPERLVKDVLAPLFGGRVSVNEGAGGPGGAADVTFIYQRGREGIVSRDAVRTLAEEKLVVMTPQAARAVFGEKGLAGEEAEFAATEPCARIETESFLTAGLRAGDIIAWASARNASGRKYQWQMRADAVTLMGLGFQTIATSACGLRGRDGRPLVLWRAGERGGGILVMDLGILESRALDGIDGNMAALVLANACGRPQAYFGTYVAGSFDYGRFCEELHTLAGRHAGLEVAEEGRSGEGRPIYSISLGPKDAPAVYVDCGIHPDEWAPCYGVPMYFARLADELERGLPWARALAGRLRVTCIPILGADGWEERNRLPRGVNLNRNFPPNWQECPDADKGAAALSEPEARIVDGIFRRGNVIVAVNWHETSANTNWIGYPNALGRYAKYSVAAPAIFRQVIDGRHFWRQPSVWTQVYDQRNYGYHYTDSFPYLRDYSTSKSPFEINHAETFGIDGLIVEQYGNSDFAVTASAQRTDMAAFIMEMILGLQVGLVCRNPHAEEMDVSFPVALGKASEAAVYSEDGGEWGGCALVERNAVTCAEGRIPPGGCMVVLGDPAPWKKRD